jgi:gluconate kinase
MGFVVLTGASGSGKTAIAEAVASRYAEHVDVYHFERVGVPPLEQMIAEYGSGEAWQRAMTFEWMAKLAAITGRARAHSANCIIHTCSRSRRHSDPHLLNLPWPGRDQGLRALIFASLSIITIRYRLRT